MSLQTYGGSTSASGAMISSPMMAHLLLRGPLYIEGTAARHLLAEDWEHVLVPLPQTSAGRMQPDEEEEAQSTSSAIMELRRLSGLTWEQLATLFNVARRSLHFWASGKPVNAPNEERLRRVLAVVRKADRGFASKNRAMLLEDRDGVVPFDLLARGKYETFIELVGTGPGRRELKLAPLSPEALEARKPQPPEELVGALQDRVHVDVGRARPGRAVKIKK
ncbi:MAG TPA: helix-turn-helix transcriptional regulator [Thermoanaerobaculaceae bacterium]|nr:helix-turn-helix transcriptional regulator [Thermoanaerobaculaceae bacterium]HRS15892.1 helix-turn-helix transcriptional regulator [Thermoanaerobaculaceae bacterium]